MSAEKIAPEDVEETLRYRKLRILELESQLRVREHVAATLEGDVLACEHRVAELGAENATLRERFSAFWEAWADVLWSADDPHRPAQPEDATTFESLIVLVNRFSVLMCDGNEEVMLVARQGLAALADLRAEHARQDAAVEAEIGAVQDNLSKLQAEVRS